MFLMPLLAVLLGGSVRAQPVTIPAREIFDLSEAEWSILFPRIPNCEPKELMLEQTGDMARIYAFYSWTNSKPGTDIRPPKNYICGNIEYAFSISGKAIKPKFSDDKPSPFTTRFKLKTFDAYAVRQRCGVGSPGKSLDVYFANDKKLSVNDKTRGGLIRFPEKADYLKIKAVISKLAFILGRQ